MNLHLSKELRPLLLPWCLAALGALGYLFVFAEPVPGDFTKTVLGLAAGAFGLGVLVLAALPVATEIHERTLTLFFSQPVSRSQLWKEKLLTATIAIGALALVHGIISSLTGQLIGVNALLWLAFVVAALSSVGYYTLATGSIIVGICCSAGVPMTLLLVLHLACEYAVLHFGFELNVHQAVRVILLLTAAYSSLYFWLSHRQFVELELRAGSIGHAAEVPRALVPRALPELFRARPTGAIANLIRKEFCLQKPTFLVSAIFTAGWLLTLLLRILHPAWHANLVATFHGITGAQVVLMVLLVPCVALGDDKSLGTIVTHLSLPVSSFRQWAIKLLSAAAVFFLTAIVLPLLLAMLVLPFARVGLVAFLDGATRNQETLLSVGSMLTAAFIISFWSASLASNTVKAAIASVFAMMGAFACVIVGLPLPELFRRSPGFETNLVGAVISHFQLPPTAFEKVLGPIAILIALTCLIAALVQSLRQFRRVQTPRSTLIKYPLILAALLIGGSFWCHDLLNSYHEWSMRTSAELSQALNKISAERTFSPTAPSTISLQELEATHMVSPSTINWLRNRPMTVLPDTSPRSVERWYSFHAVFSDGKSYLIAQFGHR